MSGFKLAAAVSAVAVTSTLISTGVAKASPDWDAVARCESGNNWSINTGNGYSGGLQWAPGTWARYRAPGDPVYAWQATREQQIAAAERLFAVAGRAPWPVCGRRG